MDANKIARRKCWETGTAFETCAREGGMFGQRKCSEQYNAFVNCCYHEREVELDKMRRNTKQHTEWFWLNIYDENGEIGKQAEWKPEENVFGMWKQMLYHMFYGQKIKNLISVNKEEKEVQEKRLEELRQKQGRDVEYYKDELFSKLNID